MSKILGIACSKRRLGNSDLLLQEALLAAKSLGAETEYLRLADLNIKPCLGCLSCVYKGTCAIKDDDMETLWKKLKDADGLIIAAPTYLFSPPGIVKKAIDRTLSITNDLAELAQRKRFAATINVAGNIKWNFLGVEFLNLFALAYHFEVIDYLEAYSTGPGEVLLKDEYPEQARRLGEIIVKALSGEVIRRKPELNQCPACYSKSFQFASPQKVFCCVCATSGKLVPGQSGVEIIFDEQEVAHHFWTPAHRRFHLDDWVIPTKDVFLKKKEAIKPLLAKYRQYRL